MKVKLVSFVVICILMVNACKKGEDRPDTSKFNIINNGGAVEIIEENPVNKSALAVQRTVPTFNGVKSMLKSMTTERMGVSIVKSSVESVTDEFPANLPIMFFFNNKLYFNSIENNFVATVDGNNVFGTIVVNVTPTGGAIITFTPWKEFATGKVVEITIKKDMLGSNGVSLLNDVVVSFVASQGMKGKFDDNMGFEKGSDGVFFIGDGAILSERGPIKAYEGKNFAAISTGRGLCTDDGIAIGNAASMVVLGPINKNISNLSFWYDFVSAEFNEYVGSQFDDCAVVTIYGPKGAYSELVSSVNTVGKLPQEKLFRTQAWGFGNWEATTGISDGWIGHTGWLKYTIDKDVMGSIGTPAYLIFTITDVADLIFNSVLAIDGIKY